MRLGLYCGAVMTILVAACARRPAATPTTVPAPPSIGAPAPTPEEEARAIAEPWLLLIDRGQYGESWDAASTTFKAAISRADWADAVTAAIGPFGRLQSRTFGSARYTENLPGAPPGKYVILQYNSVFTEGAAVETIVPIMDTDGKWRVSGYFLR